ncbi:MAG: IS200/IS605 family transposase [Bacteroidales bacterium]
MAHTYTNILIHYIFSTKNREKIISEDLQKRLWSYMGGIARENNMKALAIGGVEDHVHLLISLPPVLSIAKAIQLIKGASSKWVHDTFPEYQHFKWQSGYGAFSVSLSQADKIVAYINRQKEHHRKKKFQEEYIAYLKKHGIEYDEKDVWR